MTRAQARNRLKSVSPSTYRMPGDCSARRISSAVSRFSASRTCSLSVLRQQEMRHSVKGDDLARAGAVDQDFRMRRDDELASPARGDAPQQVVDLLLQDDVEMRVRLVQQKDRGRPGEKESQQQKHLMKTAPRAGDIQLRKAVLARALRNASQVFANDERSSAIFREEGADSRKSPPLRRRRLSQSRFIVSVHRPRAKDSAKCRRPYPVRSGDPGRDDRIGLLGPDAREWRDMDDRDILCGLRQLFDMLREGLT